MKRARNRRERDQRQHDQPIGRRTRSRRSTETSLQFAIAEPAERVERHRAADQRRRYPRKDNDSATTRMTSRTIQLCMTGLHHDQRLRDKPVERGARPELWLTPPDITRQRASSAWRRRGAARNSRSSATNLARCSGVKRRQQRQGGGRPPAAGSRRRWLERRRAAAAPGLIGVGLGELGPGGVHHRLDRAGASVAARGHVRDIAVEPGAAAAVSARAMSQPVEALAEGRRRRRRVQPAPYRAGDDAEIERHGNREDRDQQRCRGGRPRRWLMPAAVTLISANSR